MKSALTHLNISINSLESEFCPILIFLISQLSSNSNLVVANLRSLLGLNRNNKIESSSLMTYSKSIIDNIQKIGIFKFLIILLFYKDNTSKEFLESPWYLLLQNPDTILKAGLWIFQAFLNLSTIPSSFSASLQNDKVSNNFSQFKSPNTPNILRKVSIISPKNSQNPVSPTFKGSLQSPLNTVSKDIPIYAKILNQIKPNVWRKIANVSSIDHVDLKAIKLLEISAPSNVLMKAIYLNFILNKKLNKSFEVYIFIISLFNDPDL